MNLVQLGNFTLNSGAVSSWKLDCDAFTDEDWRGWAELVRIIIGPFSSVEGVPRGGLRLAAALKPFCVAMGPHLIVDDVLTTGGSMKRQWATYQRDRRPGVTGAVIFARGQCPRWIKAVCQLPECLWVQPRLR